MQTDLNYEKLILSDEKHFACYYYYFNFSKQKSVKIYFLLQVEKTTSEQKTLGLSERLSAGLLRVDEACCDHNSRFELFLYNIA